MTIIYNRQDSLAAKIRIRVARVIISWLWLQGPVPRMCVAW